VIDFKLDDDGSITKVKARFVGCGYSQIAGVDYDQTYAATLPSCIMRLWASIVADEDLETDAIDAVKAFTQSLIDRLVFVAMPIGFSIEGYVLRLKRALEGIKQGSYLWFQKNKWAFNKVGMFADVIEPNLYTHENKSLRVICAVFADDVAAGFSASIRTEYLNMRREYGKLINIDSPGPERTVPVVKFTGTNVDRDRAAGTLTLTMRSYVIKLAYRHRAIPHQDMPVPKSKAERMAFDNLTSGEPGTGVERGMFLEKLGEVAWPATVCFPELADYVSVLGSCMIEPTAKAHKFLDHVLGYVLANGELGITYGGKLKTPYGLDAPPPYFEEARGVWVTHDSSWGTRPRPQGGHGVFRMNALILWRSRSLKVVTDSTAHAETAEGSAASKSTSFIRMVCVGAGRPVMGPTSMLGDNLAMYRLVNREGASSRSRHFERATVMIKFAILRLICACIHVSTTCCVADIFTKATDEATFLKMRSIMRNVPLPGSATVGEKAERIVRYLMNALRR
jgi:hypothetical protein